MRDVISKFPFITININYHRELNQNIEEYVSNLKLLDEELANNSYKEIFDEIIKRDTIIEIYLHTSTVGEYYFFHYDYDEIVKMVRNETKI